MDKTTFDRISREYALRLFADEGIFLSDVTDIGKRFERDIPVTTRYTQSNLTRFLRIKPPKNKITFEPLHLFSVTLRLASGANLTLSVQEERFIHIERVFEKGLFFNSEKEKILRPKGFAGFKSIWEFILTEVKNLL